MKKIEKIIEAVQDANGWEYIAEMACMFSVDAYGVSNENWNRAALRVAHFVLTKWAKTAQDYHSTFDCDKEIQVDIGRKDIGEISEIVEEAPSFDFVEDILNELENINLYNIHECYIRWFIEFKLNEILALLKDLELDDDDLEELQKEAEY